MRHFILLLSIQLVVFSTFAAVIKGKVTSNNKNLEFATVSVVALNRGDRTDINGDYSIDVQAKGTYTIQVSLFGYEKMSKTIEITTENVLNVDFELIQIIQEIDEVTVTTSMKEVSVSDSPIAIDVVSAKLFEKNPTPSIFESLNMVNGVRPQLQCNVCNTGDIHINGMEGPYTMVMIDGMPIVSALGSVYGLMGIPNAIIQRVEVQKGPASTLYGSEAVGGLINVITKAADCGPKFTFDAFGTSYSEFNGEMSATYKLGKRISGIASGSYFHFDKLWDINNDNFTDVTLQKRAAFFNKFSFQHKSGELSHLAVRYYYENRWGGEMQWNESFRGTDSVYGESIYTHRIELMGASPLRIAGQKFKLQYSFNRHDQNSAYGNTPFDAIQNIGFTQLTKNIMWSRHDLLLGAALRYTYYDDNTMITQSSDTNTVRNAPLNTFLPGIFVQDEFRINEKHILLVGLRYDYNTHHGSIFSPRANWKFDLNKNNVFRLGIGNGYRVVNLFSEDHAAYTGARKVVILSDLKPEQSWNANFNYSVKRKLKNESVISADFNLFYTYFSNKIVADYFTDPNKVIFDNLHGYGINRGGGVQFHYSLKMPLKIMIGATFTDLYTTKKDSLGQVYHAQQVQTPKLTSNFVVSYKFKKIRLSADLSGNIYSPMILPILPNDYRPMNSPWFSILNIQLTKEIKTSWQIYAGVKNFLNFIPKGDPIMRAFDPFDKHANDPINNPYGYTFDPGYNYAPYQKARLFVGVRYKI
jgi:outer membrane receptor for ferrienterochelin and colicins